MRKTNEQLYDEAERFSAEQAMRDTDQEIMDYAFDREPDDDNYDDSLEMMESFDGEPLSLEEIAEGPNENGYDRPLALRAEIDAMQANTALRNELADERARYDREFNAPERRDAREAELREKLFQTYGFLPSTDEGAQRFFADMTAQQQHIHALNEGRINSSMAAAHGEYGREFEAAFESLTRADRNNPTVQALVRDIVNSSDPGERLMEVHYRMGESGSGRGGGEGHWMSNYSRQDSGRSGGRGGRRADISEVDGGWGNHNVEQEIFESAFRD